MTEKRGIIAVERGVVSESADVADLDRLFALSYHFLCDEQTFVHNIFFRCLVQLTLEQTEKIALAYE